MFSVKKGCWQTAWLKEFMLSLVLLKSDDAKIARLLLYPLLSPDCFILGHWLCLKITVTLIIMAFNIYLSQYMVTVYNRAFIWERDCSYAFVILEEAIFLCLGELNCTELFLIAVSDFLFVFLWRRYDSGKLVFQFFLLKYAF